MIRLRLLATQWAYPRGVLHWCIWLVLLLTLNGPLVAAAHGGWIPRLTNVAIGPYRLYVWSAPEPPRVGAVHLAIAVTEDKKLPDPLVQPVLDLDVQITMKALDEPGVLLTQQGVSQKTLLLYYYETDFQIPAAGQWQTVVTVTGPAGSGAADFQLEVLPTRRVNWSIIGWGAVALLLAIGLYGRLHSQFKRPVGLSCISSAPSPRLASTLSGKGFPLRWWIWMGCASIQSSVWCEAALGQPSGF